MSLNQALITKDNAESYAAYAWANNMSLDDLMILCDVIIDVDAINPFTETLNSLADDWEKSLREQMEEEKTNGI